MRRLTTDDYSVDAVPAALVGAWLCRRLEDGSVVRRRITFIAAPRIGIAYASKHDQNRKWPGVYPFFESKMGLHPMFMRVRLFREVCFARHWRNG